MNSLNNLAFFQEFFIFFIFIFLDNLDNIWLKQIVDALKGTAEGIKADNSF